MKGFEYMSNKERTTGLSEAEAIAKANRQLTLIGVITTVIIAFIIGIAIFAGWKSNQPKDTASNSPSFVTNTGAIVITKDGVDKNGSRWNDINSKDKNTINGLPVLGNGQDPLCPGCGAIEREVGPTIKYWVTSGKLVYKQYPISILNRLSDNTEYSTRVAAAFYRMAEVAPEHYLDFVEIMYSNGVQPDESNFVNIEDSQIAKYAVKAGATPAQAKQVVDGKYREYVDNNSYNLSKDESLYRTGSDGAPTFMTPLVIINGKVVDDFSTNDFAKYLADNLDLKKPTEAQLEKIDTAKKALVSKDAGTDDNASKDSSSSEKDSISK